MRSLHLASRFVDDRRLRIHSIVVRALGVAGDIVGDGSPDVPAVPHRRFTGHADDRTIAVAPGDICLFDMLRTLKTQAGAFSNISVMVPRMRFANLRHDLEGLTALLRTLPDALAQPLRGVSECDLRDRQLEGRLFLLRHT